MSQTSTKHKQQNSIPRSRCDTKPTNPTYNAQRNESHHDIVFHSRQHAMCLQIQPPKYTICREQLLSVFFTHACITPICNAVMTKTVETCTFHTRSLLTIFTRRHDSHMMNREPLNSSHAHHTNVTIRDSTHNDYPHFYTTILPTEQIRVPLLYRFNTINTTMNERCWSNLVSSSLSTYSTTTL